MISIWLFDPEDEAIARGASTKLAPRIATNATAAAAIVAFLISLVVSIFCFPPPRSSGNKMGKDLWRKRSKIRRADTIMSDSERATGEVVKEIIERDGSIKTGLARGLINARALARYIQVATGEQHSLEAIVSAIRRYPLKESFDRYQAVGKFIQKITLKNKMVHVLVQNNPGIPLILARFSEKVNYGGGETFHSVTGIETMSVVIDSKNLGKLLAVMPKSSNLKVEDVDCRNIVRPVRQMGRGKRSLDGAIGNERYRHPPLLRFSPHARHGSISIVRERAHQYYCDAARCDEGLPST
jgi:hypothetical protein